jgi:DNA invertase Pin-like site-specific DNA recombinase
MVPPTPLIAAIYARKSTEQRDVSDEAKSVTRQIAHATEFATRQGWAVDPAYVYEDDGVSGAEFVNRPGFQRLLTALTPQPPFQVLVTAEASRLGREPIETLYWLKQIVMADVAVWYYLDGSQALLDTPENRVVANLRGYTADSERHSARLRTKDALLRKARAGYVTGGRCFGYDNVEVKTPDGRRDHVDYRINPAEAPVVVRAFQLYAEGYGQRQVGYHLNAEGALSPRSRAGRPRGWSATTVRDLLHRELYRGVLVWNREAKRDAWGRRERRRAQRRRTESDWVRVERPDLRIVSEDLWQAVQARLAEAQAGYLRTQHGRLQGRPVNGTAAKYLLTGMAQCGTCRGALTIRTRSHGRHRVAFYRCLTNVQKGVAICPNTVEMRMTEADTAVLHTVKEEMLRPEAIEAAIEAAIASLRPDTGTVAARRDAFHAQLQDIERELQRLAEAIATAGGDSPTLVQAIQAREAEKRRLGGALAELDALSQVAELDIPRLRRDLAGRLTDWQGLLSRQTIQARQILAKLLEGRLIFTPATDGTIYEFEGKGRVEPVLAGVVGASGPFSAKAGGAPRGSAHRGPPSSSRAAPRRIAA